MTYEKVTSSNIDGFRYYPKTFCLKVVFTNGACYEYAGVEPAVVAELRAAPSVGQFLNARIKGHYQYRKLEESDAAERIRGHGDDDVPLRESLAALAHAQWSDWMAYLFTKTEYPTGGNSITGGELVPQDYVDALKRQAQTPYADLSEAEKELDRIEADKVLALLPAPWSAAASKHRVVLEQLAAALEVPATTRGASHPQTKEEALLTFAADALRTLEGAMDPS